jgi:excisionase family DNA binding protein
MPERPDTPRLQPPAGPEPNNGTRPGCAADGPGSLDVAALVDAVVEKLAERLAALSQRRYLSVADASAYCALSQDTLRGMLSSGRLTAYRPVRGRVLIDVRELDAVIQASTKRTRHGRGRYDRSA